MKEVKGGAKVKVKIESLGVRKCLGDDESLQPPCSTCDSPHSEDFGKETSKDEHKRHS